MPSTTYTLLVTIAHEPDAAPPPLTVERTVAQALGEGTRNFAAFESGVVSVVKGDMLLDSPTTRGTKALHMALRGVKP